MAMIRLLALALSLGALFGCASTQVQGDLATSWQANVRAVLTKGGKDKTIAMTAKLLVPLGNTLTIAHRKVTGRGSTPEASQEAAERRWVADLPS